MVFLKVVFWLVVSVGFIWLICALIGTEKKQETAKQPVSGQVSEQGGTFMFKKRGDALAEFVKQVNEARDELGLPRLPIETIPDAFSKMSPELLAKLEVHLGPVFKENVAGWMSLVLELIGKHNEDLGRLSISTNRWTVDYIKLRDAGRFAVKNLDTALDSVDAVAAVLAEHGEEKAEDVRRFLRRRITTQILLGDYLPKLPGAPRDPELIEAVIREIIPLLPNSEGESQVESAADEVVEGDFVNLHFGSNGDYQGEKEYSR